MIVPILDTVGSKHETEYLLTFSIDPDVSLFPLIQSWPTSSKTSETVLFTVKQRRSLHK